MVDIRSTTHNASTINKLLLILRTGSTANCKYSSSDCRTSGPYVRAASSGLQNFTYIFVSSFYNVHLICQQVSDQYPIQLLVCHCCCTFCNYRKAKFVTQAEFRYNTTVILYRRVTGIIRGASVMMCIVLLCTYLVVFLYFLFSTFFFSWYI